LRLKRKMQEHEKQLGEEFLKKHLNAHVSSGNRKIYQKHSVNWYDTLDRYIQTTVEDSIDISLSKDDYKELIGILYNHYRKYKGSREYELREKYPTLKSAYEKYQMILSMIINQR